MFNGIFSQLNEVEFEAVCTTEGRIEVLCGESDFSIDILARHILLLTNVAQIPVEKIACQTENVTKLCELILKNTNNSSICERIRRKWSLDALVNISYFIADGIPFYNPTHFIFLKNAAIVSLNTYYVLSDKALFYQSQCGITIDNLNSAFVVKPTQNLIKEIERRKETNEDKTRSKELLLNLVQGIGENKKAAAQLVANLLTAILPKGVKLNFQEAKKERRHTKTLRWPKPKKKENTEISVSSAPKKKRKTEIVWTENESPNNPENLTKKQQKTQKEIVNWDEELSVEQQLQTSEEKKARNSIRSNTKKNKLR